MPDRNLPAPDTRNVEVQTPPQAAPSRFAGGGWEDPDEGGLDWRKYLAAIWRRSWLVAGLTVLGLGVGVAGYVWAEPEYSVQATVWIDSAQGNTGDNPAPIRTGELLRARSWVDLLQSFAVLDPVVQELHLYVTPQLPADSAVVSGLRLEESFQPGRYRLEVDESGRSMVLIRTNGGGVVDEARVGEPIGASVGLRWTPPGSELTPGRRVDFSVVRPRDAALSLAEDLTVGSAADASFLQLRMSGTDSDRVARVVNAIADQFVRVAAELKRARLDELTGILTEQVEYAQAELQEAEFALENFKVQTISLPSERATPVAPGLEQTRDPVFTNFFNLKLEQEELRRDEIAIQRALSRIEEEDRVPAETLEMIPRVRESGDMSQVLAMAVEKRAELRSLRLRYTDEHPLVQEVLEDLRSLENETIPALLQNVRDEVRGRQQEIDARVGEASVELRQIPPRAIEEARLERQADAAENLFRDLQQRYETARLAAASTIPDVRILDRAFPPQFPTSDPRPRLFLMASLAGLGMGLAGALLMDHLDRTLRYPDQVTRGLGLPILGTIPHLRLRKGRVDEESQEQVVEAFRDLRLAVSHSHGGSGATVACVTSPAPGDGKSFTTSNLALAFAEMGSRVLVIDGDVRKGTLHTIFGVERKPGLTEVLSGQVELEDVLQSTGHPSLTLLPSGSRFRDGPELLSAPEMQHLIEEARERYDVVLVDSPPLGATVDPFVLGTLAGSMILVLRNGRTDKEIASGRLGNVDRLPIHVLGAVLNDVPVGGIYQYYSYLPGYGATDEGSSRDARLLEATG